MRITETLGLYSKLQTRQEAEILFQEQRNKSRDEDKAQGCWVLFQFFTQPLGLQTEPGMRV